MSERYLGEIRMFGGDFPPVGWAFCDGSILSISENPNLFYLIGTTYGGDGVTTFALPDLRGRTPLHMGTNPHSGSSYVIGQQGGTETVQLTGAQLPAHTHAVQAERPSDANLTGNPAQAVWAPGTLLHYATGTPNVSMNPASVGAAGSSQPHDNMMPYLATSFIISLYGNYPTPE